MAVSRGKALNKRKQSKVRNQFTRFEIVAGFFFLAFAAALLVYSPSLNGPFIFDDRILRYAIPSAAEQSVRWWIAGLRPVLFLSYWLNHAILGDKPFGYHLVNVAVHALNSSLVLVVTYRLLNLCGVPAAPGKLKLLAAFTAAVFLLHPIQTESVSYTASRSETLCAFFMLCALALFLYRIPGSLAWPTAIAVLLLFGAACATKEQGVILAPVLILADLFWNTNFSVTGLRRNWRLYAPLLAGGGIAAVVVLRIVGQSTSAGFRLRDVTWLDYFFTECRVIFSYIRLFLLPVDQTIDHEIPFSKGLFDHGSVFGLVCLVVCIGAAIYFRRRYRLAAFGALLFLVLMAPTSSFVPLLDPLAEHRLYLPTMALLLVLLEFLLRLHIQQKPLAAICMAVAGILGLMCFTRNQLWGSDVLLWKEAVTRAPDKVRPYFNLASAYIVQHRCDEAVRLLRESSGRIQPTAQLYTVWGRAEECLAKFDDAALHIGKAAELRPQAALYIEIGLMRARQGKAPEALNAFQRAIQLDPASKQAYIGMGDCYEAEERFDLAAVNFRRALELNPDNTVLRDHLQKLEQDLLTRGAR